jgi:mutator protein MutT
MDLKRIDVAIGIVLHRGRILICQRRTQDALGGYWEFPGGKQEPGESIEQCLTRELAEELGIVVRPTEPFAPIEWNYPAAQVRLHPYLCELVSGQPTPLACQQVLFVKPADLLNYRFPPANDDLIRSLAGSPEPG